MLCSIKFASCIFYTLASSAIISYLVDDSRCLGLVRFNALASDPLPVLNSPETEGDMFGDALVGPL